MEAMEDKLGAILNNPQMMEQIMSMAKMLGQSSSPEQKTEVKDAPQPFPELDPAMLQRISGFARESGIDPQQKALLNALAPYISRERVNKLEKAMRAAKIARFAASFLGSGIPLLSGR